MKISKIILSFLTVIFLSLSFNAVAAPDLSSLHAIKQTAKTAKTHKAEREYYRTEIHVVNNSSQQITVKVVDTPINDLLFPGEVEDIYSNVYFDAVLIVLYDESGYEFFRDYVPNHSVLEVRDFFMAKSVKNGKKLQAIIKK